MRPVLQTGSGINTFRALDGQAYALASCQKPSEVFQGDEGKVSPMSCIGTLLPYPVVVCLRLRTPVMSAKTMRGKTSSCRAEIISSPG